MSLKYFARFSLIILCGTVLLLLGGVERSWAEDNNVPEKEQVQSQTFTLGVIEVVEKAEGSKNLTIEAVTNDQMRLFERNNVAEAVNLLPGVAIAQAGARNETTVYIRGFDIKHVPIFLDGIPIYVPYDGYPDLGRFTTFDLSEIVVSKGFTSVLYGPNTMGGAINMISRRPTDRFEMNVGAGYGSGETYNVYGNFGTRQNKWYMQGGASYIDSSYFDLSDDFKPTSIQDDDRRLNSYFRDRKFNVKFGFTPNETDEYAVSYINQHGVKGVPPYTGDDPSVTVRYWQWPYWDKESVYFNSFTAIGSRSYLKTRIYYDKFENALYSYDDENYNAMTKRYTFKSYYDDHTIGGSAEAGTKFGSWNTLKAAFHYKRDYHEEHNEGDPIQKFEDEIISFGAEDTIDITKKFYAILGASYDRIETIKAQDVDSNDELVDFPMETNHALNGQVGLFYKFHDNKGLLHASISRKTRLPSIKDKYSYKLGKAIPNPSLDPEKAIIYETGCRYVLFGDFQAEGTLFFNDVTDYILSKTVPDPDDSDATVTQNQNIGDVNLYGFELSFRGHVLEQLELGVNYTLTENENNTTNDKLIDIPKHKIFAFAMYKPINSLSILADIQYNASRYSSSDGNRVADNFTVVNAKILYEVFKNFIAEFGVNNVTDADYAYDEGYPQPGRTFFGNIRYSF